MYAIPLKYTIKTGNSRKQDKSNNFTYILEPDNVVSVGSTGHSTVQVDITSLPAYRGSVVYSQG